MRCLGLLVPTIIIGAVVVLSPSARAGLINGTNTAAVDYFMPDHIPADAEHQDVGGVAGPFVIPVGGLHFQEGALSGSNVDVLDTQLIITNDLANTAYCFTSVVPCSDAFDGFEFFFTGTTITGVTVDAATPADFQPIGLTFTATDVLVNLTGVAPGLTANGGPEQLVLDLTFGGTVPPTVPEPMSLALFGSGLVALSFVRRRAKRSTNTRSATRN